MKMARVDAGAIVERIDIDPARIPAHKRHHWREVIDDGPPAGYVPALHTVDRVERIDDDAVRTVYTIVQRPHDAQVQAIKAEQARRIVERYPEWRQLNVLRAGTEAEIAAMDAYISGCGLIADELEALNPVPADYADDSRWPA